MTSTESACTRFVDVIAVAATAGMVFTSLCGLSAALRRIVGQFGIVRPYFGVGSFGSLLWNLWRGVSVGCRSLSASLRSPSVCLSVRLLVRNFILIIESHIKFNLTYTCFQWHAESDWGCFRGYAISSSVRAPSKCIIIISSTKNVQLMHRPIRCIKFKYASFFADKINEVMKTSTYTTH